MFERQPIDLSRLDSDPFRPEIENAGAAPIMAYVLFMDIVGYTRMPMERQRVTIEELQSVVFATAPYVEANVESKVVCRPTGDGMALIFLNTLVAPARCATAVARELRLRSHIRLRMGIHGGHVFQVTDALGNKDVIGEGINNAQRVMDCGDIGHILLSQEAASLLGNLHEWKDLVHDLGHCPVKHGQMIHLFNLCSHDFGNRRSPRQITSHRKREIRASLDPRKYIKLAMVGAAGFALWQYGPPLVPSMTASAKGIWHKVFKTDAGTMLVRSSEFADEKKWKESIAEAKSALKAEGSTPEQRGEAYYRIISAYYHMNDVKRAAAAAKSYRGLSRKIAPEHWTRGALKWEPQLYSAFARAAFRDWRVAERRAESVYGADDSTYQQRAESLYLLANAAKRRGDDYKAARYAERYDGLSVRLSPKHWTRAKMAQFSGTPNYERPHAASSAPAVNPAEQFYHRITRAYLKGNTGAAARELQNLDRFASSLAPEQLAELRRIAAGIPMQAARTAFDRKQYRAAIASSLKALGRLDSLQGDDNVVTSERARALYYLAASYLRMGERERAQRYVEMYSDRCGSLGPDNPWSHKMALVQQTILDTIPTDPIASDSEPTGNETESESL